MLRIRTKPHPKRPGVFVASLEGKTLCISRTPLADGARVLLKMGFPPAMLVTMRHWGSNAQFLRPRDRSPTGRHAHMSRTAMAPDHRLEALRTGDSDANSRTGKTVRQFASQKHPDDPEDNQINATRGNAMPFDGTNYDTPVTNPVTELLEQRLGPDRQAAEMDAAASPKSADGRRLCSLPALQAATIRQPTWLPQTSSPWSSSPLALGLPQHRPWAPTSPPSTTATATREVAAAWQRAIDASRTLP